MHRNPSESTDARPHPVIDMLRLRAIDRLSKPDAANIVVIPGHRGFPGAPVLSSEDEVHDAMREASSGADRRIVLDCSAATPKRPIGHIVSRLMADFSDDRKSCHSLAGALELQIISAQAGLRPFDSEAVREHFRRIHDFWPFWLHFLVPTRSNLTTLMLLLCDPVKPVPPARERAEIQLDHLLQRFDHMLIACDHLQRFCGYTSKNRMAHVQQVLACLKLCLSAKRSLD